MPVFLVNPSGHLQSKLLRQVNSIVDSGNEENPHKTVGARGYQVAHQTTDQPLNLVT